jgi:hypothetical protein
MKTRLLILTGLLALFICLPVMVNAQEDIDKRIENAQKEIEKLKEEKLKALEEQKARLTQNVEGIKKEDPVPAAPGTDTGTARREGPVNSPINSPLTQSGNVSSSPVNSTAAAPASSSGGQAAFGKCSPPDVNATNEELNICSMAQQIIVDRFTNPGQTKKLILLGGAGSFLQDIVANELAQTANFDKAVTTFLLGAESARLDKQAGADSKSAGTTSLAVKGGVPAFLSWAMENGGAEGSRDGNTLTFRINPVGFADSLKRWGSANGFINTSQQNGLNDLFRRDDGLVRVLRNTSVGFSFDITRGTDPPVFIGSKQQLSSVSVRYQFLNERDPLNPKYEKDWLAYRDHLQKFSNVTAKDVAGALFDFTPTSVTFKNKDLNTWLDGLNTALEAHPTPNLTSRLDPRAIEEIRVVLEAEIAKLPLDKLKNDTVLITALNSLGNAQLELDKQFKLVMDKVAHGQVITFEYTNYRNVNAPDLSNFRFIASKGFWYGADLTFNGSLTMYNKKPASADPAAKIGRIRDFDFTGQVDIPFSSFIKRAQADLASSGSARTPILGIPIFTFAGKYQRLQSDTVLPDGTVKTGTRGDLAFGQAKLTIPINFSGLSFNLPFSVTFANRTDLIKEKEVRGNFGFTFDLDPFFSRLKSSIFGGEQ